MMTVNDAAARLGLSTARVRALCAQGRIPARKMGRDWVVYEPQILPGRPAGRPRRGSAQERRRTG